MPLIALSTLTSTANMAGCLWQYRAEFGAAASSILTRVEEALTRGAEGLIAVRGGEVVYADATTRAQTLGFLQRADAKLDGITASLDGGFNLVAKGLDAVQTLVTVGIGVSIVSHILLSRKLALLQGEVARLGRAVADIQTDLRAKRDGDLEAGIKLLGIASAELDRSEPQEARQYLPGALETCLKAAEHYSQLLKVELASTAPRASIVITLARFLGVATAGVAGCHIGLGRDANAIEDLDSRTDVLRQAARHMFVIFVGTNPERFLAPGLAAHGIGLDTLVEVYRQASLAEVIDGHTLTTAADLFEKLRGGIGRARDPRFRREQKFLAWKAGLATTRAAVEDVNRLDALKSFVQTGESAGGLSRDALAYVRRELAKRAADRGSVFLYVPGGDSSGNSQK
jgi:hypothetical protein